MRLPGWETETLNIPIFPGQGRISLLTRRPHPRTHRWIRAKNTSAMGVGVTDWVIQDTTPRGLRAAGVWPSEGDAARALIRALDEEIEEVPEGSPKSNKLKALRESAQNVGENTLAVVLAGAMKYGFGF